MIPRQSLKLHSSICLQCLYNLAISPKRSFSSSSLRRTVSVVSPPLPRSVGSWQAQYFLANGFLGRGGDGDGGGGGKDAGYTYTYTTPSSIPQGKDGAEVLPHRRRQQARHAAAIAAAATIPPDASSLLSTSSAASPKNSIRRLALSYLSLSKPRLTALIVLTTMTSYALFPLDPLLSSGTTPTLSALTLAYLTTGTALSSASANTLNMYLEPNYDAKMSRTRNRPLVRGLLSNHQALGFAAVTGVAGISSLYIGVNPTVASLAALNIFLYAGVYTPLKRVSVINTWVGAIVGGIPPLMGWAAASGAVAVHGDSMELLSHPGGWLLAGLLFAWQFPHFNALSWSIRAEYKEAGYQMMAWKYPALNARVALRYSFLFFPICVGLSLCGVTDYAFLVDSSVVNAWLVVEAWRFWKNGGGGGRAKKLFWASVWHLPVLMGLAMLHKKGLWSGVWEKVFGSEEEDEGEWGEWEDEEEEDGRRVGNVLNGVRELVR